MFSGIFSAGLSTISAALNSLAAVTLEDYIKPVYRKYKEHEISPKKSVFVAKVLAFMFGILSIALAFLAQFLGGLLQVILSYYYNSLAQYWPNIFPMHALFSQYIFNKLCY